MFPPPSPAGSGSSAARKSKGGDMWGAAAESWSSGAGGSRRTPGQGRGGRINNSVGNRIGFGLTI